MTRSRPWIVPLAWLLVGALLLPVPALAAGPNPSKRAVQMHKRALREARRKHFQAARELWEAAFALHPTWEYAFHDAQMLREEGRWDAAWQAVKRAKSLGVPPDRAGEVQGLEDAAKVGLLSSSALLTVRVEPTEASVWLGDTEWPEDPGGGRERWLHAGRTVLRVEMDGYRPFTELLDHPAGAQLTRTVALEVRPADGVLVVRGGPDGAAVLVNGERVGILPEVRSTRPPGVCLVSVAAPGYVSREVETQVRSGEMSALEVTLEPEAPPVVIPEPAVPALPTVAVSAPGSPPDLVPWAWVASGIAVAGVAAGAGMFAWAGKLESEGELVNASPPSAYADYQAQRAELRGQLQDAVVAGWVTTGIGVMSGAAAIVLFLHDGHDAGAQTFTPMVTPGGAGATVRF